MKDDKVSKLMLLKELYEKGSITAEQLASEKAKIMGDANVALEPEIEKPRAVNEEVKESSSTTEVEADVESAPTVAQEDVDKTSSKNGSIPKWLFLTVAIILLAVCGFLGWKYYQQKQAYLKEYNTNKLKVAKLNETIKEYEELATTYPIIIEDVLIANIDQNSHIDIDFGKTISASRSMYIKPKIKYTSYAEDSLIKLKVKLFSPNGLSQGDSSPSGYTFEKTIAIRKGKHDAMLSAWGGSNRGYWGRGNYRIEIWYNDVCLKTHSFRLY
jgi:hypothetical protein